MIEEGAIDGVDAIFGMHVFPLLPTGSISSRSGVLLAAAGHFKAVIQGKGGHAAVPHLTADPIVATSMIIVSLQQLISRETNPLDSQVVSVTSVHGGEVFNIIPQDVTIKGTYRTLSNSGVENIKRRIKEVIENQAIVLGCTAVVEFGDIEYPALINNQKMYEHIVSVGNLMLGEKHVLEADPTMGAEDFSFYMAKIPGAMLNIGVAHEVASKNFMLHSPFFNPNEDVLPLGAAMNAAIAEMYIQAPCHKGVKSAVM
ncbi:hypothetical protein KP509_33G040500 [Ceratopteris richardii]|nr:hypothetical protein KP509_33G040500 [Ceratopteris richardii]